jgi:DNA-binding NtrC family response regulator
MVTGDDVHTTSVGDASPQPAPASVDDTQVHNEPAGLDWAQVQRFRVTVIEGPATGLVRELSGERFSIGSHPLNDLVIDDATVSRFHCEIRVEAGAPLVVDLKSKNGTTVDGVAVREAYLRQGSKLGLGSAVARFDLGGEEDRLAVPRASKFGALVGAAPAMRTTLALLARAAASDTTVLLEGETGTGKGKAAEALHQASARKDKPFIVVDCGAIPENLLESELFGHEKGSFTGAHERRIGAFEEASGGTIFLDEIGEMPQTLQPKLLRALENREIRRVGANRFIPVDIRVIAATNRDLRAEVNAVRFRADLYFRLAVAKIPIPPLRERKEDLRALVEELLRQIGASDEAKARLLTPVFMAGVERGAWPGNVRELRNHVERSLLFDDAEVAVAGARTGGGPKVLPYTEARRQARDVWERRYLEDLLAAFEGKVAQAADAAGVDRVYLYRLMRRHGLKPGA